MQGSAARDGPEIQPRVKAALQPLCLLGGPALQVFVSYSQLGDVRDWATPS